MRDRREDPGQYYPGGSVVPKTPTGQGGGGTSDYSELANKPKINNHELVGNKTAAQLGLATPSDIPDISGKRDKDDRAVYDLKWSHGEIPEHDPMILGPDTGIEQPIWFDTDHGGIWQWGDWNVYAPQDATDLVFSLDPSLSFTAKRDVYSPKSDQQLAAVATGDAQTPANGDLVKYDAANDRLVKATAGTDFMGMSGQQKISRTWMLFDVVSNEPLFFFDLSYWLININRLKMSWGGILNPPTTLSGYGITDARGRDDNTCHKTEFGEWVTDKPLIDGIGRSYYIGKSGDHWCPKLVDDPSGAEQGQPIGDSNSTELEWGEGTPNGWSGAFHFTATRTAVCTDGKKFVTEDVAAKQSDIPTLATPSDTATDAQAAKARATYDFVNSSINAMAAFYITKNAAGDSFATKAELTAAIASGTFYNGGQPRVPTKNDYLYILADESHPTAAGTNPTTRYSFDGAQWSFQIVVNDTALTEAQLAAMNSGINAALVTWLTTFKGTDSATTLASILAAIASKADASALNAKANSTSVAPAFDATKTYAVDEVVTHDGNLYRCTTAVTTAGAWNAANWTLDTATHGDTAFLKDAQGHLVIRETEGQGGAQPQTLYVDAYRKWQDTTTHVIKDASISEIGEIAANTTLALPPAITGHCRDFVVEMKIGATVPTFTFPLTNNDLKPYSDAIPTWAANTTYCIAFTEFPDGKWRLGVASKTEAAA